MFLPLKIDRIQISAEVIDDRLNLLIENVNPVHPRLYL